MTENSFLKNAHHNFFGIQDAVLNGIVQQQFVGGCVPNYFLTRWWKVDFVFSFGQSQVSCFPSVSFC